MEIRQLRYFLDICETEHLTRSAANLFITQSTLSHGLRQLEDELGVALFERIGRGLRLSQAGRSFRDHASRALQEIENGRMALNDLGALRGGVLKLGVIPSYMTTLLPPAIARFHQAHPGVDVVARDMTADAIHTELLAGRLDLGISFDASDQGGLLADPLFTERLNLVVPLEHPLAGRRELPMARLDGLPCILQPRAFITRRLLDAALRSCGASPRVRMEIDSVSALLATAARTGLTTVVPERAAAQSPELRSVRLHDPVPQRRAVVLRRPSTTPGRAAQAFTEAVQHTVNEPG
ncbi:MAG: LysR family transcriptional regulator [Proteobacteria bacterium]|nr:LysR family transcriptional regulator [Pseudomonadota bacterium]